MNKSLVNLFLFSIIPLVFFSCTPDRVVVNQNILDFAPPSHRGISAGMIGYFFYPYQIFISTTLIPDFSFHLVFGEREAGGGIKATFLKRGPFLVSGGFNYMYEGKKGMKLLPEEDEEEENQEENSSDDEYVTPSNIVGEAALTLTYRRNFVMGWLSFKPGLWWVNKYVEDTSTDINGNTQRSYVEAQQKFGLTLAGGFGYYDPEGFMALLIVNRPFITIKGDVDSFDFIGFLLGVNFNLGIVSK